ncbi:uncharacterized protein VTP21DRAFT_6264 [Calcarisporiella thermophila]|uniref:uncharacterized protein n=1 Tax=Calcarisporiella thermophila TaxID=911321 RepID=UPI0037449364
MSNLRAQLESESNEFQQIQKEISKFVETRERLESQLRENELVDKEFQHLEDDANIYKLLGPVLVKQEKSEAKLNVSKRLEYIKGEIERVEKTLTELSQKAEKKKTELMKLQSQYQEQLQTAKA